MNPTFSRKHYQEIAKVINRSWGKSSNILTGDIIKLFKEDNPRFDEPRFLRACTIVDFKEEK